MSERYLQSLAILLAGLFSAERARSKGPNLELPSASVDRNTNQANKEPNRAN